MRTVHLDPFVSIAVLLAAALVGGMLAHRLRQPLIVGYLVVGVAAGPSVLGVMTDLSLIKIMATIGVALLMFTLGLEISVSQFKQVGKVGLWGSIIQIITTFLLGWLASILIFHWAFSQAILFGLIISLSSTAVCLKILIDRGEVDSVHGRIMIAILILQDISVVAMMVVVPLLSGERNNVPLLLGETVGKTLGFIVLAVVSGTWLLPWLMGKLGGIRSKELFLLTVLVLCLGSAAGTQIIGLSTVFGSFLIGLVLRQTRFIHQALAEITPLRDIFATLFFVSLGMLLDPVFAWHHWGNILAIIGIIIAIKGVTVFGVVRSFGFNSRIGFLAAAGLFQIGEFGFILAQSGVSAGFVSDEFYSLIIASAILTMLLTPLSLSVATNLYTRFGRISEGISVSDIPESNLAGEKRSVIIAGYGRIGQSIAQGLENAQIPYSIIDIDPERIAEARAANRPYIYGDASNPRVLGRADLSQAKALVIVFPDPLASVATARAALEINPHLHIIARAHRGREAEQLKKLGVVDLVSPEYEASFRFIKGIFSTLGLSKDARGEILDRIREDHDIPGFSA
jgi:monovalent cation:H+ antiporter-2, CPA2 family